LKTVIGWREWIDLPGLAIRDIKAKVDTGARTSALHAFRVVEFKRSGERWVRFAVHPIQRNTESEIWCEAAVVDKRIVRDSGGHEEKRVVIATPVRIADAEWSIEVTLTDRDNMGFRMLLGRRALKGRFVVDPARSYLTRKVAPTSRKDRKR